MKFIQLANWSQKQLPKMVVQTEGNRQVKKELEHYNLDMII